MKNYLVTGVSKGLGLEITKALLEVGDVVYGISREESEELKMLKSEYPYTLKYLAFDLSDNQTIKEKIFIDFIGINTVLHGYVNNAAYAYDDIITNLNFEKLLAMYKLNVFSPMEITKRAIRNFILHNTKGSIVHISSISAHTGYKGLSMYASTKGALEAFSKNVAREWGERGIRSNSVVVGFMETSMSSRLSVEQKERIFQRTSLKRAVDTKSVASTVAYLLSENASSITGQNIFVDCGTI